MCSISRCVLCENNNIKDKSLIYKSYLKARVKIYFYSQSEKKKETAPRVYVALLLKPAQRLGFAQSGVAALSTPACGYRWLLGLRVFVCHIYDSLDTAA